MRSTPLFGLLFAIILGSQPLDAATMFESPAPEPGSELTVYLMTMGPGKLIYERFGHNAIWISDPERGLEHAYNYGLFDFRQPNFLGRFIRGEMLYSMAPFDAYRTIEVYRQDQRSVWVQELELTPAERLELRDFLEWNALPENRDYRYDYFYQNCSTRVRDALDMVLGGAIRDSAEGRERGKTFRWHSVRLVSPDRLMYTLFQAGFGRLADEPIGVWEEMFVPMRLQEELRLITVSDGSGGELPLVRSEEAVYIAPEAEEPLEPPRFLARFLFFGLLTGLFVGGVARMGVEHRAGRIVFALVGGAWGLVGGVIGTILVFLWIFTDHTAAHANENILQLSPLLLALPVLLPAIAAGRGWGARWGVPLLLAVLALSLAGLLLNVFPGRQENGEIIAFVIPLHLALAWGAVRLTHGRTRTGGREAAFLAASRPPS